LKLLIDESVDAQVAERLEIDGHEVICVWDLAPGVSDEEILSMAAREGACLITADKDFGELVFRMRRLHTGVTLIRLSGLSPERKCKIVSEAVMSHEKEMKNSFMVISPALIRIRR